MIGRKFNFSLKIVVVGDSGVGKTCYLLRYVRNQYDPAMQPTLGVEFLTKIIETSQNKIQLQLWDTAGQELFRSVTKGYYRGSSGAFLVFDITKQDSFKNIERWLFDVKEVARPDVVTILIGNKSDLEEKRKVTREEAEAFAKLHQMPYFETSAKEGDNIDEPMKKCVEMIEKYVTEGVYDPTPESEVSQVLHTEPDDSCPC
ncbi:small GTP-binding protein [Histomonas meleagridis]|uniref:small GTP-binding protein n=1 Tax=Histomonas meleagridis TaxID=135588 RepID=UPI003559E26C|nr:small GTP-binding protein [Histomonas meleagridis]KAH0802845.1 small GTP-binding protein [Histomonas meleagridis]